MISSDVKDFPIILETLKSKQSADTGVLIGYKYQERFYIYSWCPTPKQSEQSNQLSTLLNTNLSIPEATYSDWVLQHCKELSRFLPAGLQILGLYSVAEEDLKLDNFGLISPLVLKLYSDLVAELCLDDILCVFHYNLLDNRYQTGALDLKKKNFVPGEIRQVNLVKLEEIRGIYRIDLELGADGNGQELIQKLIAEWNLVLENSIFVIDKQIPKDDSVLSALKSDKNFHTVQIFCQTPGFCCNYVENSVRINGFVEIFALAHPKSLIRTVKEIIIKDILFSLKNRVELLSDEYEPEKNPFLSSGKAIQLQLPRRISFSCQNFSLTGYTMKDPDTLKSILISISSVKPSGISTYETLPEFPEILEQEIEKKITKSNPKVTLFWIGWSMLLILILFLIKKFNY